MHRFDVYPNPESRERLPDLVVLQSELLERLDNGVVAPLRGQGGGRSIPILRLNPVVEVEGQPYFVRIQDLAAIPAHRPRQAVCNPATRLQPVCNLSSEREARLAALDLLFTGVL